MTNNAQRKLRRKMKRLKPRKKRPKSFKTGDAANAYAKKHGIKRYNLVDIRQFPSQKPKIRIVIE